MLTEECYAWLGELVSFGKLKRATSVDACSRKRKFIKIWMKMHACCLRNANA